MRLPTYEMLTWNLYYGVADPRNKANDFWFCFVIKWDLHCLGSCNEYLYGTEELFRQYFDIELMENIIFHTQYIKMEIRSLHKGVTKSFHYEAIFYLFHHKNGIFMIFTYQISDIRGTRYRHERRRIEKEVFILNVIYSNQLDGIWHLKQDPNWKNNQKNCQCLTVFVWRSISWVFPI